MFREDEEVAEPRRGRVAKEDKACSHCHGTGKKMHGVEIPCPWCSPDGDPELRGSE